MRAGPRLSTYVRCAWDRLRPGRHSRTPAAPVPAVSVPAVPMPAPAPAPTPTPAETASAFAQQLGMGVNIGALASPAGGMPLQPGQPGNYQWPDGSPYLLEAGLVTAIAAAGFRHIRLPVRWSNHASLGVDAVLEPSFLAIVISLVVQAQAAGLQVVLDMHHYRQLDGDASENGETLIRDLLLNQHQARAVAIWTQLASHFQPYRHVAFEIYNEPHGNLDAPDVWASFYRACRDAIRAVDADRIVLQSVPGYAAPSALDAVTLEADDRTIITVHPYGPWRFTHSGAWGMGHPRGALFDEVARDELQASIAYIAQWSRSRNMPVYCGEIGSCVYADAASRIEHARAASAALTQAGLPAAVWDVGSDFGLMSAPGRWNRALVDAWLRPEMQVRVQDIVQPTVVVQLQSGIELGTTGHDARVLESLSWSPRQGESLVFRLAARLHRTPIDGAILMSFGMWNGQSMTIGANARRQITFGASDGWQYVGGQTDQAVIVDGRPFFVTLMADLRVRALVAYVNGGCWRYDIPENWGSDIVTTLAVGGEVVGRNDQGPVCNCTVPTTVMLADYLVVPTDQTVPRGLHEQLIRAVSA